ncbi:hypothetical protein NEOLEDRAFT_874247 [Neolentinus lepideus HHB14362 ss-1]|uniref:Uncharacterized protein n=1 Tax=Neolentinus lepideus HHB14362 ss-1 TaxID=1314782 RepID=A0A165P168_9AGAM|nr:hypothetical protein NEOLEDRAFT_874247 [Neolentinus lepideus HHB14362 ss-1]
MTEGRFPGLSRPLLDGANGRPQSRFSFRRHSNSIHSCPDADVPVQHQDKTNILPDHFSRVNASEGPGMVSSGFDIHGNHTPPPPVSLLGSRLVTIPHSSPDGLALPTVKRGLYTDPMRTSSTILRTPQQCPSFFPHGFTNASVSTENMHPQSLSKEIKREHFDLGANALSVRMEARDVSAEGTLQSNTWEIRNASSASLFKLARDTPSLQSSTARYSRAPSEVSFNGAMPDDDISMVMMRGATDLRNAKIELEELRRQVKEMKHQVELAQKEKTEAERRWNELKQSSLKGIESSRESVSNMRTRMSELELESRDAFGTAKNLKLSLSELKDLRRTIAESLQTIEPLLGDHGEYLRVSTTKDVVKELKMQAANTQQVVDLLRDQLTASGSELVQANARIAELEECRRIDGEALRASAARVNDMTSRLSELAICLQQQRDELMDALVSAASSESKLEVLRAQIADVTESLRQKNVQLEAAGSLKELNIELQRQVEVYAIELQGLESTRTELRTQTEAVQDREARIKSLVQTLETQEKNTIELKDR